MPKKRKSGGRSKGGKGMASKVQCSLCGQMVPRDKAKKMTSYVTLVDRTLAKELRSSGASIPSYRREKWYCVSCAVHRGVVKVRSKSSRRSP